MTGWSADYLTLCCEEMWWMRDVMTGLMSCDGAVDWLWSYGGIVVPMTLDFLWLMVDDWR